MSNSNEQGQDGLNPTLRNYYRLAQQQEPASNGLMMPGAGAGTGASLVAQNQPPPSNQIAENL